MNLDFLKNVQLEEIQKVATVKKQSTPKLPESADIRIFANGKIYPSEDFAKRHNLEYGTRGEDKVPVGNGMDIFSSDDWAMINGLPQTVIFGAVVAKSAPKVDVWGSTKYEDDGTPKSSVLTQGSSTFVKTRLLGMLAKAYGIDWDNIDYADFNLLESQPMVSPTGIYVVPKVVSTGPKKGQADYIRRENINICPLVLVESEATVVPASADNVQAESTPEIDPGTESTDTVEATENVADSMFDAPEADANPEAKGKSWSRAAMEASS